jgi:hypothetical protein
MKSNFVKIIQQKIFHSKNSSKTSGILIEFSSLMLNIHSLTRESLKKLQTLTMNDCKYRMGSIRRNRKHILLNNLIFIKKSYY